MAENSFKILLRLKLQCPSHNRLKDETIWIRTKASCLKGSYSTFKLMVLSLGASLNILKQERLLLAEVTSINKLISKLRG